MNIGLEHICIFEDFVFVDLFRVLNIFRCLLIFNLESRQHIDTLKVSDTHKDYAIGIDSLNFVFEVLLIPILEYQAHLRENGTDFGILMDELGVICFKDLIEEDLTFVKLIFITFTEF